jgi:predicted aldo/keto reductase-like oxidoreductase
MIVGAGAMALPSLNACAVKAKTATDIVPLGQSGLQVSRLGMGTGSNGGHVQRTIGQDEFTRVVRYAIDRGVTFFDTADNYNELHEMLRTALEGVDREKIQIQTKISRNKYDNPRQEIDRLRQELGTDYLDSLLIHCTRTADWVEDSKALRDLFDELKAEGIVKAVGVSMHGLLPFNATVDTDWGDIRLIRINHNGAHMDGLTGDWQEPGDVPKVVAGVEKMHAAGKGIIGMKLIGNGDFTDPDVRKKSIDFVMGVKAVDSVIIGLKSTQEVDEAIENMNNGLAKRV